MHRAIRAGSVHSCHDLSEGGLAVAAAEMAIGGGLGLALDLRSMPTVEPGLPEATLLFAESPTRFLVEVAPEEQATFTRHMARTRYAKIGRVLEESRLRIVGDRGAVIDVEVESLRRRWQAPLGGAA